MKRIILTESQYKRLVRRRLNEQNFKFSDGYSIDDIKSERVWHYLAMLLDSLWYKYKKDVYIKSIEGDKVVIDLEKYDDEEKKFIKDELDRYFHISKNTEDSYDDTGNMDFSFDTEPVDDEEIVVDEFEVDSEFGLDTLNKGEKIILHLISEKESVNHSYDSANPNKIIDGLSELTMEEAKIKNGDKAIGRYQFMPENFNDFVTAAGLKMTDKFSPENQDKMALTILKGKMDDCLKLEDKLVRTWAALPLLYDREITYKNKKYNRKRGESYYQDIGGNKSYISPEHFESALSSCGCNMTKLNEKLETKIKSITPFEKYLKDNDIIPVEPGTGPKNGVQFDKIPGTTDYRSGQPTLGELAWMLQNYNIKRVIRLNSSNETAKRNKVKVPTEKERELVEAAGAEFYPKNSDFVDAHNSYETNKGYQGTIKKVLPILEKGNTLIHCRNGADRTGYLVAKYIKDNKGWDDQKLWNYTTEYNSWCGMSKKKFEGNSSKERGGYDAYAQGFIDDIDYEMKQKLCNNNKGGVENDTDKIKILVIGDSQSAGMGKYHSKLDDKKYSIKNNSKESRFTTHMLSELIKEMLYDYDVIIIMGGGNDSSQKISSTVAQDNLKQMYNYVKDNSNSILIVISNPTKKYYPNWESKYPSNDKIAKYTNDNTISDYEINSNGLGEDYLSKDKIHLNSKGQDWIYEKLKNILDNL
tara:strand:- start:54 stop:2147 length:2094 start_codon:yes stop_codon:yes gene_type:complete